jgi:aldehyde dehydrogenase (NAD+)
LFLEAGFPADLLQKLPATRDAGPRLAEADIDHLVFTGSDAVGRKLAARLGERLVPSTLELSGCDAMFVLADADVGMAAKAAWFGVTLNRGQTCIATRRVFVHREKVAAFTEELRKLAAGARPMGLVTPGQREVAERLIADAVGRGATPLGRDAGPQRPGPHGMTPTFLLNAPADAAICREACFAPVAAVIPFDTVDDAVSLARRSPFGLGSSVFTADVNAAQELAARIPAGSVTVNDVLAPIAHPATPFGGRGASGWGVTQGAEGLLGMTVPQVVTVHRGRFRPHLDEAVKPDPDATHDILRGLLRWTHARGFRENLRGLWQMIRGVRRKK